MDIQAEDDSEFDSENQQVNIQSEEAFNTEILHTENDDQPIMEVTERDQETVESDGKK